MSVNRYYDLDLELYDYHRDGDGESLRTRVTRAPVGAQREIDAPRVQFPSRLRGRLRELERRGLELEGLIEVGEDLAGLLLPLSVRAVFRRNLDRLGSDDGLRLRIRPDTPELAALPWEYAYVAPADMPAGRKGPEGFLALDPRISLVRHEIVEGPATPITPMLADDIRLVALLSEVDDAAFPALDLAVEELNLRQALAGVGGIDLRVLRPGTHDQLEEVLTGDATVFHFAGHGEMEREMGVEPGTIEGSGRLILSGDDRRPVPLDATNLALELGARGVRLAVLSACEAAGRDPVTPWSGVASALFRQGIPAVVGMQYTVRDRNAIAFSRRFYRALGAGKSIDTAVSDGRLGIFHRGGGGDRDWGVPVLYLREGPSVLFPPPAAPFRRNLGLAVAAVAVLGYWFSLHIYPLVGRGAASWTAKLGLGAGALAVLAALGKLVGSYLARAFQSEQGSFVDRWLRHRRAPTVLVPVLIAALLLFGSTSSIYLRHDDDSVDQVQLALETSDGYRFDVLPELVTSVEDDRTLAGGPLLLRLPPRRLLVHVEQPAGWDSQVAAVSPRPWRRVQLLVSRDLVKTELRILRLAPNNTLAFWPAAPGDEAPSKTFALTVTIGDRRYTLEDFRQGVVYLGGPPEVLTSAIAGETIDQRRESLRRCLFPPGVADAEMMGLWGPEVGSRRQLLETPILTGDETLVIEVVETVTSTLWSKKTVSAAELETDTVNTVCLGRRPSL
jgi:hypothetical protein